MDNRFRISQESLKYLYDTAKKRMKHHPEYAEKYKDIIQKHTFFKTEKEALENAIDIMKKDHSDYQIWAKIEKAEDVYRIQEWWIVTDDWKVKQAADYIGMALMYDTARLYHIINDNIKIDNVVAYW